MSFKVRYTPGPLVTLCTGCGGKGANVPHSCYNCMRLYK